MTAANLVDLVMPQPACDVLMRAVQCCYAWNMESGVANLCRFKYKSENIPSSGLLATQGLTKLTEVPMSGTCITMASKFKAICMRRRKKQILNT